MQLSPFSSVGNTVNISATVASANVALAAAGGTRNVRVYNDGSVAVFINFGTSNSVTASASTSIPVAPGSTQIFSVPGEQTHVAAVTGSSTGTIYFTSGYGV